MDILKIISTIGAVLAVFTALFGITKFFLEVTANRRKQLREDYDALLLALKNTDEKDLNRVNIIDLAEAKKYQLIVGIPSIDKRCAQNLLRQSDKSNRIYQYRRSSSLIEFSEVDDKFNYSFGFKTKWIRATKKWGALILYIICFLLATGPIFFWKFLDPNQLIYNRHLTNNSLESFWSSFIIWVLMFLFLAFTAVNYASKIYFAEKLVENKISRKPIMTSLKQKIIKIFNKLKSN